MHELQALAIDVRLLDDNGQEVDLSKEDNEPSVLPSKPHEENTMQSNVADEESEKQETDTLQEPDEADVDIDFVDEENEEDKEA